MGSSYGTGICSSQLPDEHHMVIIPAYLCVNIMKGAIVEYTVGTSSVTGVHVKFDFGDGFWATWTSLGVVITGGSQSSNAWIWTGATLENLSSMSASFQRHCAISHEDDVIVISGTHTGTCEALSFENELWRDYGQLNIQRSNATAIFWHRVAYVAGGIDKYGAILSSIETYRDDQWNKLTDFQLPTGIRNAGAVPLTNAFLIFGGSSRPEISSDHQNFAWKVDLEMSEVRFYGRVNVNGSFSPYQATIRDNIAAIFSEDGKLYQFDYTYQTFSIPDFIETP